MVKEENEKEGKKEYLTIDETAQILGWNRATIYKWIEELGIKKHKFKLDRRTYLAHADVQRLKEIRDKPWLAGPDEDNSEPGQSKDRPIAA